MYRESGLSENEIIERLQEKHLSKNCQKYLLAYII